MSPFVFDILLMLTMSLEKISDALRASMSLSEDTTSYPSILMLVVNFSAKSLGCFYGAFTNYSFKHSFNRDSVIKILM